ADLAEDLRLTEDHRVETRRDAEEMTHGRVPASRQRRLPEEAAVHAMEPREESRERIEIVLALGDAVDLGAVARRDDRRLREDPLLVERAQRLARLLGREREPLPQVEGRAAVVPADEDEVHERKT